MAQAATRGDSAGIQGHRMGVGSHWCDSEARAAASDTGDREPKVEDLIVCWGLRGSRGGAPGKGRAACGAGLSPEALRRYCLAQITRERHARLRPSRRQEGEAEDTEEEVGRIE